MFSQRAGGEVTASLRHQADALAQGLERQRRQRRAVERDPA
jgi:hypothetical protein